MLHAIRFPAIACLFLFLLHPAIAQQPWSLQDCIDYALENNIRIKQQKLGVEVARENLSQGRANYFPNLNLSASHVYNFGQTIDPFTNEFATERVQSNNFSMSSGMTLFSGFQITNAVRQAGLELKASRHDVEQMQNDISLAVASAYLQILFSKEMAEMAASQLEITRQQVERTAKLVEAGTLARGSLLTIQAQEAAEELQVVNANNQLEMAYLNLAQLLDLPPGLEWAIEIPEVAMPPAGGQEMSPMQVYLSASQIQPEVRAAEIRVRSAEKGLQITRGAQSPMLSIRGSYGSGYSGARREITGATMVEPEEVGWTASGEAVFVPSFEYDTRIRPFGDQLSDNLNRSIGLFLTIPVFNNLQTRTAIGRSRIALENARLGRQLVQEQLFKTIQQAHADATAALKRYQAGAKSVDALEEAFRYTEQRFNVGMVNSLEYNDAKNRLAVAQSEWLQSRYEYVFRMQILRFYQGQPLGF